MWRFAGLAGSVLLLVALGVVGSLTYGAEVEEQILDRTGDLELRNGYKPPERRSADVISSAISSDPGGLIFDATMAGVVPPVLADGYLDVTWRIDGDTDWVVTVSVSSRIEATVVDQATSAGSSTTVGTFPGTVDVEGDRIEVRLDTSELAGFPDRFRWAVFTKLDLQAGRKGVGVILDGGPQGRYANFRL